MFTASSANVLHLKISPYPSGTSVAEALKANRHASTIHLELESSEVPICILIEIFETLTSLPDLKGLHFRGRSGQNKSSFAVSVLALATAVANAPGLIYLSLQDVGISGTGHDYNLLSKSFQIHANLKHVCISGCLPAGGSTSLEPFLGALREVPSLQEVVISNTMISVLGSRTCEAISELCCRLPKLEAFSVKMLPEMQDKHLAAMIRRSLKTKESLRRFIVHSYELGSETCIALADMLRSNKKITRLDVSLCTSVDYILPIIKALETPEMSLQELDFRVELFRYGGDYQQFMGNVLAMVKKNHTIKDIRGLAWPGTHSDIRFYLELNRLGIKEFLCDNTPCSKEKWLETMISKRYDTKVIYYLLSENPSMIETYCDFLL